MLRGDLQRVVAPEGARDRCDGLTRQNLNSDLDLAGPLMFIVKPFVIYCVATRMPDDPNTTRAPTVAEARMAWNEDDLDS